ncbi:MAG: hypothetical protein KAJ93_08770 [Methanosarcinales archaeon]|nr:hypothetical protein [Methanosarcinales archaeon]
MATTKVVSVLDNDVTLTAAAGDHTSTVWTIDDGYGGELYIKITNGATGPTIAAEAQIWASPDNSNWYEFGGPVVGTTGNSEIVSHAINIPVGIEHVKVVSGSNTGQNVTIRVEGSEITAIS